MCEKCSYRDVCVRWEGQGVRRGAPRALCRGGAVVPGVVGDVDGEDVFAYARRVQDLGR